MNTMKYNLDGLSIDELIESDIEFNILTAEDFNDIEINDEDIAWMDDICDELFEDEITSNIPLLESRAMKFARLIQ